jgi:protein OS-9
MIKEVSTCSYLMIIYTPRLCNDAAFQPPQVDLAHHISCQPVLAPSEVDQWTLENLEYKISETERLITEAENNNPLREMKDGLEGSTKRGPVIGGIEIGAQALVGGEGKVMEKGVVVGGGKETNKGTVLNSKGMQMSQEELKHLGISAKTLEEMKKKSKEMAAGETWKLDVIDTGRGREFRLIIDAEEEEGKIAQKKVETKGDGKVGEKGTGMKKEGESDTNRKAEGEEKESQEGSEEVYKDEL